jgi:hypothetical protein
MSTPQEEALEILDAVVRNLTSGGADLKLSLRRCAHAVRVLGWTDNLAWLNAELDGFRPDQALPGYRKGVQAYITWRAHTMKADAKLLITENGAGRPTRTPTIQDVRYGVAQLVAASGRGLFTRTGREDTRYLPSWHEDVPVEEVQVLPEESIAMVLQGLENALFTYASQAYTLLRFGDAVGDIWRDYRRQVDEALGRLGLHGHLDAIRAGLESDEPQRWREAMWSCRDLLRDLAAYLWRDTRATYPHLKDKDGGPVAVTTDKYLNRLAAYLHQKGVTGTVGAYLRAELDRINSSIHALNELYSKAHEPVSREDARLAAVTIYTLLGELVARTDMVPVEEYK